MPGCTCLPATGPSIAWGTGLPAIAHRGYWPGCYMPQVVLGVMTWLLQAPAWPGGTGLAATAHRGLWPGCYSPQGARAWLLQTPGWPEVLAWLLQARVCPVGTGLAATAHRGTGLAATGYPQCTGLAATGPSMALGYWPCCYRPKAGLWLLAWLLQPTGVLAWLLQAPCWLGGTGLPAAAHQVLQP